MTEAAVQTQASTTPDPDWEKVKVSYIPKNRLNIRIIDRDGINNEYAAEHLDLTPFQASDMVQVKIYGGKIMDIRFPPGMDPVTNTPIHSEKPVPPSTPTQAPATQPAKVDEVKEITGDVSLLTEKGIKIGSLEMVFINSVSLGDIKEGTSVKAKISGNKLTEIEKYTAPTTALTIQTLKEDQTALKSIHLNEAQPHVILVNLKGEFRKSVEKEAFDQVQEVQPGKLIRYSTDKTKAGNPIKSFWEVDDFGKSLKPRNNNSRTGGGGYRPDPQLELIKNLSIITESVLNKSLEIVKSGIEKGLTDDQIREKWNLVISLTKTGLSDLYQEIEKKHKYGGQ